MEGTEKTRNPEEIRERIADRLGYCHVDGSLHNPDEFEEKMFGAKWSCPDCGADVNMLEYKRATELRWALGDAAVNVEGGGKSFGSPGSGTGAGSDTTDGRGTEDRNPDEQANEMVSDIEDIGEEFASESETESEPESGSAPENNGDETEENGGSSGT
ncbi:MAG: hypothetical protein SV760_05210 [Halobacteria archaeon]|nr:hypothetical protein [Halobacteria archaeon]